jgi:serine protease Do
LVNAKRSLCAALLVFTASLGAAQTLETAFRTNGPTTQASFESVREVLQGCSAVIQRGNKEIAYGTVMTPDGMILTKASEIGDGEGITVTVGTQVFKEVALLATEVGWDVALLKVKASGLTPVQLATDSPDPERGTWVVANGATSRLKRRPQVGIIAANARELPASGGVVLGITFKEEDKKMVVQEVHEGSGAAKAGILKGDVIVAADGQEVTDRDSLSKLMEKRRVVEDLEITVERLGQKMVMQVRLAGRDELFKDPEQMSRNDMMSGDVSERRSGFPRVIQHDIIANAKTIGGPLLDLDGRCLGMNIARANRCETFAIPAGDLRSLADRLMTQAGVK